MTDLAQLLIGALALVAAWLGYGRLQRARGKRDARAETALEAAERIAKLERERGKRDAEIQDDDDLVRRARAAGVYDDKPGQ